MKNLIKFLLCSGLVLLCFPLFSQDYNFQFRSSLTFPGQTLANICGYAQGGREYALLGASKGLIIVDVTNPDLPQQIVQIPGPDNLWKEIKTYEHYAYVTSEGGQGIQVVDLSALPSPNLNSHFYTGDGPVAGAINAIHALHIDVTKGFLYAYGGGNTPGFGNGAKVFSLKNDPYNPTFAGNYNQLGYVHDGFADNDTLYASHIYTGLLSIVDMKDKNNPVVLGTVPTPGKFTHNSWLLDDHKHVLTTDEEFSSFVTCYDISNPEDIQELDRISTTRDGLNSIGHNTHVLHDWAITSWYTDGVTIIDAHRPDNLVEVARYDTWAAPVNLSDPFEGCWGVYPYLPSGTIITSNIEPAVFNVLTPTYVRACYLEGTVSNGCDGFPMFNASIEVNTPEVRVNTKTKLNGEFKTGQVTPGNYTLTISKPGFVTQTIPFTFATGQVAEFHVTMTPDDVVTVAGKLLDAVSLLPIVDANVSIKSVQESYDLKSGVDGKFNLDCIDNTDYEITISAWGYKAKTIQVSGASVQLIYLEQDRYYDDFEFDLGWTKAATSPTGAWTLADPIGTGGGQQSNPENDAPLDNNIHCYTTGNGGGDVGTDDVDDGSVTLTSPPMNLAGYDAATLTFQYWFYNAGGSGNPNDKFQVNARVNNQVFPLFTESVSASQWRPSGNIALPPAALQSNDVRIEFITADDLPGHLVEAGVDIFRVQLSGTSGVKTPSLNATLSAFPNPSTHDFVLQYDLATAGEQALLEVRNVLGALIFSETLPATAGSVVCGSNWIPGVYFASIRQGNLNGVPLKLVKQ